MEYLITTCVCVQLFVTPRTKAHQDFLSMGFPGKNTGLDCHFPPPEDLPHPGIKPKSLAALALAGNSLPLHHLRSSIVTELPL